MKEFVSILILFISFSLSQTVNENEDKDETIIHPGVEGWYWIGDDVIECESGYFCPGDGNRYECPDGYYSIERSYECIKCGCVKTNECYKGNFIDNKTGIEHYTGECKTKSKCQPGYGYDKETKACLKCEYGLYSKGGKNECQKCRKTKVPNKDQSGCEECPFRYGNVFNYECKICSIGTYYNTKTKLCERCPERSIQPSEGQLECIKCPDGLYGNENGEKCVDYNPNEFFRYGEDMKFLFGLEEDEDEDEN